MLDAQLKAKASQIKCVIMDVDGVLTDGKVSYTSEGHEIKSFNIKDGLGIKLLMRSGITPAIITGRKSNMVSQRMAELGVQHVFQAQENKITCFETLLSNLNLTVEQVAYIGDDLPDLTLIKRVGLGVTVADAIATVKQHSDWVTSLAGGHGAVRELAEIILIAQNKYSAIIEQYS